MLKVYARDCSWIIDGLFSCSGGEHIFYPLIRGVPRILSPELLFTVVDRKDLEEYLVDYRNHLPEVFLGRMKSLSTVKIKHSRSGKTANRYAYMWKRYNTGFDSYDMAEFWRLTGGHIDLSLYRGRAVIDVGGGQGRYITPLLDAGVKEVVSLDLGEAISLAAEKFKNDERVLCVQSDIYGSPFPGNFDLVMCIGVLQHLPDPGKAFMQLVNLAHPGGRIFAWCYGDSSIKPVLIPMRLVSRAMPLDLLWWFSALPAFVRHAIALGAFGLRSLHLSWIAKRLPFGMYENYNFHYLHTNTFDHLSAKVIHFFKREDIEKWIEASNIKDFTLIERHPKTVAASWVIDAVKP